MEKAEAGVQKSTWARGGLVGSVDREDNGWMKETETPNDESCDLFLTLGQKN